MYIYNIIITQKDKAMKSDKQLTTELLKATGYSLLEIKSEYKEKASKDWKKGFWAARGLDKSIGDMIIKYLF